MSLCELDHKPLLTHTAGLAALALELDMAADGHGLDLTASKRSRMTSPALWVVCVCVLSGDAYLQASDEEVIQYAKTLAASRNKRLPLNAGACMSSYLDCILSVGHVSRKCTYEQTWDGHNALLADIDHNMGYGPKAGSQMPALDRHPMIYSFRKQRLALASAG